jgi:hypothetical protein
MYVLTGRAKELDDIAPSITKGFAGEEGSLPTWVQLCRASAGSINTPRYEQAK